MAVGSVTKKFKPNWGTFKGTLNDQADLVARVGTSDVDESNQGNNRFLVFKTATGKREYIGLTETAEFGAITWGATVTIAIPEGIKTHKWKVLIPSGSTTASATIVVENGTNGLYCGGSIYNNDTVLKTVILPAGDRGGETLLFPITIDPGKSIDLSFKNDGTSRVWQYSKLKTI